MGIIKELEKCNTITVDTSALIYYIEKHEKYFLILDEVFEKCNIKSIDFKLILEELLVRA